MKYEWTAYWFDINVRLQRRLLNDPRPESTPQCFPDPVFVLGLWRSGTTLVHELLGGCPGLMAPTTWQCMNSSSFAMARPANRGLAIARPMDAVEVAPDSPQEDEFALLALGAPSVYRAFLDPARLDELGALLSPDYWLNEAPGDWKEGWLEFLQGVASQGPAGKRLVVKSPNHSFRIMAIDRLFPGAHYIWVVRAPEELMYSNRKMWRAMFRRYGLTDCPAEKLDAFLVRAFEQAVECLDWLCGQVTRDRLAVIDFSHLTEDPAGVISLAGQRLGLGEAKAMREACEMELRRRLGYRREEYQRQQLPEGAGLTFSALADSHRRALASHGVPT